MESTAPSEGKTTRILWADALRAAAISGIVGFHVLTATNCAFSMRGLLGSLTEMGTMAFVLLAGFFAGHEGFAPDFRVRRFYGRKIRNLVFPYAIATALLLVLKTLKFHLPIAELPLEFCRALLLGSAAVPLWFMPMILLFFALVPLWVRLPRNVRRPIIAVTLVLPFAVGIASYDELGRKMLYFLGFFLFGVECSLNPELLRQRVSSLCPYASAAVLPLLTAATFLPDLGAVQTVTRIAVVLAVSSLCIRFEPMLFRGLLRLPFSETARNSMGIYLYHNSVIGLLAVPVWNRLAPHANPALSLLFFLTASLAVLLIMNVGFAAARGILRRCGIGATRPLLGV